MAERCLEGQAEPWREGRLAWRARRALAERHEQGEVAPERCELAAGAPAWYVQVAAEPGRYAPGKGALAALASAAAVAARRETPAAVAAAAVAVESVAFAAKPASAATRAPAQQMACERAAAAGRGRRPSESRRGGRKSDG